MKKVVGFLLISLLFSLPLWATGTQEEKQTATSGLREIPRSQTLISAGWDYYSQVPSPESLNPYGGPTLHERNDLHYTVYESLYYSSLASGTIEPWLAKSIWTYNNDYTEVTVELRRDVTWSDGEVFNADDVVFSANMLLENSPEMTYASQFENAVEKVEKTDDYTVVFHLTRPSPRWARDQLAYNLGQPARFVIVPEHIWRGKNALEFTNLDIEKGWPVGTGPYKVVHISSDQIIFDLRDTWWAAKAGKTSMPEVKRVIYHPTTREALSQLYISNQLDVGPPLLVGAFEAARNQNPKLISWSKKGPVWGAPNGCLYRIAFNNKKPPFDDPEIHWAINYALDRDEIVELALENSTSKAIAPLSSYEGIQAYVEKLRGVFSEFDVDHQDLNKVSEIMTGKGYEKNESGFWADASGKVFEINIPTKPGDPLVPVIAQQLKDAGFDVKVEITQYATYVENVRSGNFDVNVGPHCGSAYDPYQTLEHYHGKYAVPIGQNVPNYRANPRYSNPEMDRLLDQMARMVPSPENPAYLELVEKALYIYFRDLPDITIAEENSVVTFNTTYWTGWPSKDNPYMHPFPCWEGWARVVDNLKPVQ